MAFEIVTKGVDRQPAKVTISRSWAAAELQRAKAQALDWLQDNNVATAERELGSWKIVAFSGQTIGRGATLLEAVQSAMKGKS